MSAALEGMSIPALAAMIHEAEDADDDMNFIAACNEIERRGKWKEFREEYMRQWPLRRRGIGWQETQ